jgi:hypothetical protein
MSTQSTLADARTVLGEDLFGPDEVAAVFGRLHAAGAARPIPFSPAQLETARAGGEMLVLRIAEANDHPVTIGHMIATHPAAFDPALLQKAGYQLKSDWGIELEPLAQTETCEPGWALVRKEIVDATRNLAYDEQSRRLHDYAASLKTAPASVRRRTAVEAVYDTVLVHACRGRRLLESAWDWTSSETLDRGYLNVGGFGVKGMQILSFSGAVRHGGLGICPTRGPVD